ncbi:MAG: efflux RND transporter periplasmic adaptor subunit [Isosphaeraceae bacterium]
MSVARRLAGSGLILALAVALAWSAWAWASASRRSAGVLRLPGVVEVQEVRLGSKVGGRVREVRTFPGLPVAGMPVEGSVVDAGTVLVTFEVPELEAQLAQWKARLASDLATLDRLRKGSRVEEIRAGEATVAAAQSRFIRAMVGFREEEVRQSRNDWQSAEADLKFAEEELARSERLWERRSIPKAELDSARASYDRARGRAQASRARYDLVTTGNRPEDIAEANALLDEARANLDLLRAGTRPEDIAAQEARVEETQCKIRELEANLAEADVRAPSRSVVDVVSVRKGDLVAPGQVVVRVLQADDLWVKVFIPETELGKVRLNQKVDVTVDSYPGKVFTGTMVYVAPRSEFTPRNIQSVDERRHQVFGAKVRVADPQGVFKAGMAAQVVIPVEPAPAETPG